MEADTVLDVLRRCGALLEGHFELRSGLHSDRFFQCAHVLCHPAEAECLCAALAALMRDEVGEIEGVVSPALGGIVVGHEVARALGVPAYFAEKDRETGALEMRRFKLKAGCRYVIAEDVVTRGGRVQETVDLVRGAGAEVAGIGVLVDRSAGKASFDYPFYRLLAVDPVTYTPGECPLCDKGLALVHPGS